MGKSIFQYYQKDFDKPLVFNTFNDAEAFFMTNKDKFEQLANRERSKYNLYLNQFKLTDATAIVETFSWHFTAQRLLNGCTGQDLLGLYWQTTNKDDMMYTSMYKKDSRVASEITNWDLMELFFTSPELPVTGISSSGTPEHLKNASSEEQYRCTIYLSIHEGILNFVNLVHTVFGEYNSICNKEDIKHWINCFTDNFSSIDKQYLSKISVATDTMHTKYTSLV